MKYIKYLIISFTLLLSVGNMLQAQNLIQITPTLLPPYSPYFSDYLIYENKTTIVITGPNAITREFFLRGTVTGDNGVSISTKVGFKPTQPLRFTNGPTLILKGSDIEEYLNWQNVNVFGIDLPKVAQGDGLPEGNYTICLRAFDYNTGEALSQDAPNGCVTISIRNIEPPIINLPRCGSNITPNVAQNIVFSWNPPPGAPANTRYLLKVAEMTPGFTNYNDALNTLTTPAFYEKEIFTSTYAYTLADAPLTVGKTYAFKVVAFDPNNKINFRNGGESEVCYFIYGGKNDEVVKEEVIKPTKAKLIKYSGLIPTTTIKGKLQWAFYKDDEKSITAIDNTREKTQKEVTDEEEKKKAAKEKASSGGIKYSFEASVVKTDPTYASAILASQKTDVQPPKENGTKLGGFVTSVVGSAVAASSNVVFIAMTEQSQKASTIQSMVGSKRFAYKNAIVKIYLNTKRYSEMPSAMLPPTYGSNNKAAGASTNKNALAVADKSYTGSSITSAFSTGTTSAAVSQAMQEAKLAYKNANEPDALGRILLGTTTTNDEGEFSVDAVAVNLWKMLNPMLSIEFSHPHFIFATRFIENIQVNNGVVDLGTHIGLAKTYEAKIKVQSPNLDYNNAGEALDNATVKILRKKTFYAGYENLIKEGNAFNSNTVSEGEYEVVAQGKAGSTFNRLFLNGGNYTDEYSVVVENREYKTTKFKLKLLDSSSSFNEQFNATIENYKTKKLLQVYELTVPTFIKGILVVKGNDAPIAGATVTLVDKTNKTDVQTVVTDSAGRFSLDDVKPRPGVSFAIKVSSALLGTIYPKKEQGMGENPETFTLNSYGDSKNFQPLFINAAIVTVKGIVKNDEKVTISNAVLKWKAGGKTTQSGENGEFTMANVPGKHILVITKSGYRETEQEVIIDAPTDEKPSNKQKKNTSFAAPLNAAQWVNTVSLASSSAKPAAKNTSNNITNSASTQYVSNLGYMSTTQMYTELFGTETSLVTPVVKDIGDVIIKRFYVKVTVKDDATKATIENAIVQAKNSFKEGKEALTKSDGTVVISDAEGANPTIIVDGPANGLYIPAETSFTLSANSDTAQVTVELKKGTALTGKVLENSNGLNDAQVFVEGKEYIKSKSDASGNYRIVLPNDGEYTVTAVKEGLQGVSKNFNVASSPLTHDFKLINPGFEVSTLLGFKIELYDSKKGSNSNEKIISGAFVKIPGNGLFKLPDSYKLKFNNVKVNVVANKIVPVDDAITTIVSEIPFTLFEYLDLKLKSSSGIKIKKQNNDGTVGKIIGVAYLDVNSIINKAAGLDIPVNLEVALTGKGAEQKEIAAFISNGALPLEAGNLKLVGINNNNSAIKLYGLDVNIDYNKCYVFKDGLQLGGTIKLNNYPVIGNKTFNINKFKINTGGDVVFDVACDVNESLSISTFKLNLGMLQVTNFGVKLGGSMSVDIPNIDKLEATFSNLGISKTGISGGQFNLYAQNIMDYIRVTKQALGAAQTAFNMANADVQSATDEEVQKTKLALLDAAQNKLNDARAALDNKIDEALRTLKNEIVLFNVVSYEAVKGVDFSFAKVPGTDDYKIQGGGTFGLKKYFDQKIKLNYFAIATDGKFAFNVELNKKFDFFSVADLEITNLGYNGFSKSFDVGGKLFLKIPGFGVGAGANISYYTDGKVLFKDASFKMDICPKLAFEGYMGIMDNGFKGGGKVKVTEKIFIGGNFIYEKFRDGFKFGADFAISPAPKIPIAAVELTINGGGFEINTASGSESVAVEVNGGLALSGASVAMDVNPLKVKITVGTQGPIIEGTGQLNLAKIKIGQAGFKIDIPNSYFTAYAEVKFPIDIIPSIPLNVEGGARVSASLKKGTEYAMLAVYSHVNLLSILRTDVNIAFAWGMPKVQGTDEDKYVAFIPDAYLDNGKVFGFNFNAFTSFGIKRENAIGFDWKLASLKGWYYNQTQAYFFSNFRTATYGFKMGSNFDAGGEASIWPLSIGVGMYVSGDIEGGYGNNDWFCNANLAAGFEAHIGCCGGGCETKLCFEYFVPCGIKVCARGSLFVGISNRNGVNMKIKL
jgi:hypothetical protein